MLYVAELGAQLDVITVGVKESIEGRKNWSGKCSQIGRK